MPRARVKSRQRKEPEAAAPSSPAPTLRTRDSPALGSAARHGTPLSRLASSSSIRSQRGGGLAGLARGHSQDDHMYIARHAVYHADDRRGSGSIGTPQPGPHGSGSIGTPQPGPDPATPDNASVLGALFGAGSVASAEDTLLDEDLYRKPGLCELVLYMCFVFIFGLFIYFEYSHNTFFLAQSVDQVFSGGNKSFNEVSDADAFFDWVRYGFVPDAFYTGEDMATYGNFTANRDFVRVSPIQLRQLRVKEDSCKISEVFKDSVKRCFAPWAIANEEKGNYLGYDWDKGAGYGWTGSYYAVDSRVRYPDTGFVVELPWSADGAQDLVADLRKDTWFDWQTRAVFVEALLYNPNSNLLAVVKYTIEQLESTKILRSSRVHASKAFMINMLLSTSSSQYSATSPELRDQFVALCLEGLVILVVLFKFCAVIRMVIKYKGFEFFRAEGWRVMDLALAAVGFVVVGVRLTLILWAMSLGMNPPLRYETLWAMGQMEALGDSVYAIFSVVLATFLLNHVSITPLASQFTSVFITANKYLALFMVVMFVVIVAFAGAFNLVYGGVVWQFRNFSEAMFVLVENTITGVSVNPRLLAIEDRYFGPAVGALSTIITIFVIASMFVSVVASVMGEVFDTPALASATTTVHDAKELASKVVNFVSGKGWKSTVALEECDAQDAERERLEAEQQVMNEAALTALQAVDEHDLVDFTAMQTNPRVTTLGELIKLETAQRELLTVVESVMKKTQNALHSVRDEKRRVERQFASFQAAEQKKREEEAAEKKRRRRRRRRQHQEEEEDAENDEGT